MLEKERIKEAEDNTKRYLEEELIRKIKYPKREILDTYKRNYEESFEASKALFNQSISNLWTVVTSYYSMYYIANAVLYNLGYKIGSSIVHKVTSDSLIVFVRNKLKQNLIKEFENAKDDALDIMGKTDDIINSYDREKEKRAVFQYETTEEIKEAKAKTSIERAKRFIFEMKKLLAMSA